LLFFVSISGLFTEITTYESILFVVESITDWCCFTRPKREPCTT